MLFLHFDTRFQLRAEPRPPSLFEGDEMKQWIKLYTEVVHDRKLWKLKPIEQLTFFYLCALAGIEDDGGRLPGIEDIELELQMPLKLKKGELDTIMSKLIDMGLVDTYPLGVLKVSQYEKRQMSNMTEAERKAIYRDKKKTMSGQSLDVCPDTCPDNVPEMSPIEKEIDKDINSFSNEKEYTRAKKSPKRKFGSAQNVLLTDDEYAKLKARFLDADERIENLSLGIASKGYKYKDHYATILNWARRDAEKQTAQPQKQPETTFGDIRNYFEAVETPKWDIDL